MLTAPCPVTIYWMPDDRVAAKAALLTLLTGARECIRCWAYGFSDAEIFAALIGAARRGVDLKIIADHVQATTPSESQAIHALALQIGADRIRIGTSPIHHQIAHAKTMLIDGVVIEGSTNWTESAWTQVNTMLVLDSPTLAAPVAQEFEQLWAWITQNEPAYQRLLTAS